MSDYVVRTAAAVGEIHAFATTAGDMAEEARRAHNVSPVATTAPGRLITAEAMMGCDMKGSNSLLTLRIQRDGPIEGPAATADSHGDVRGYAFNPVVMLPLSARGKLNMGDALGVGVLSMIKDIGLKEPYVGQTILVSGEIAKNLIYYYATSEQTPSSIILGVLMNEDNMIRQAEGFIIQLLPGASGSTIGGLEGKLKGISSIITLLDVGNALGIILEYILREFGLEINDRESVWFYCNCTKDHVEKALISVGEKDI